MCASDSFGILLVSINRFFLVPFGGIGLYSVGGAVAKAASSLELQEVVF